MLATLGTLQACYVYAPEVRTAPPVGETVRLSISDKGRVDLGERFGPGVASIEGRINELTGEQLALNVYAVKYISGENNRWTGEGVRLNREFVEGVSTRRLSKRRTWITVGGATVALTAFIARHGLLGRWTGEREEPPPPPPISLRVGFPF